MSEAENKQNVIPWKNEASEQAMLAAARVEEAGVDSIQSATAGIAHDTDEQRQVMTEAADRFEEASRELSDGAVEKFNMTLPFVHTQGGLADLQASMSGLLEGVIRTNLRLAQEIFVAQTPRAFAELQQQFLLEYFNAFQQGAAALMRVTTQTADRNSAQL